MIELTVTMVILVIAMGLAATLIVSSGGFLAKDSEMNAAKYIGDGVYSWVENRVRYAGGMTLCKEGSALAQLNKCIYIGAGGETSGHLLYADFGAQPADVYGSQFYLGNTVKLYASANAGGVDLLDLRVEVIDDESNVVYSTGSTIKLVNVALKPNNKIETESGAGETPLICFNYDSGEAGGYSDPDISRLAAVCEPLKDAINKLMTEGRASQIEALLGSSLPTNDSLRNIASADLGGWPGIKDRRIGGSASAKDAVPWFMIKDGRVIGVIYYGAKQNDNEKPGYIYSTQTDSWYEHKGKSFEINKAAAAFDSYEALLAWVQSGQESDVSGAGGTWSKVEEK